MSFKQLYEVINQVSEKEIVKYIKERHKKELLKYLPKIEKSKYVYFILTKKLKAVKIGVSADPLRRLEALQIGNPSKLKLLLTINQNIYLNEKRLHEKFEKWHIRGEWFKYTKELKDYINNLFVEEL